MYVHSFTAYQITNYWLVSGNVASAYSGLTLPNQSPNLIVTPERGGLFSNRYPSALVPSAYTTGVISATVENTLRKLSAFAYGLFNRIENTQTMQKDELNAKAEPSEFLEVPWIVCDLPSKPSTMKRSSTSVLTCLHLAIKLLYWLILLPPRIIVMLARYIT